MRRRLLASAGSAAASAVLPLPLAALAQAAHDGYAEVSPRALVFPADHGAHSAYRIEWWYLTAVLSRGSVAPVAQPPTTQPDALVGVQVTFFRVRTPIDRNHPQQPSRFAARQLLIAHAAIADPARGSLLHEQRIARVGPGGTSAETGDTALALDRWRLQRTSASSGTTADAVYTCELPARSFTLRFTATASMPLLLQGESGTMRKSARTNTAAGPASHYYSWPQLALDAQIERDGRSEHLTGAGWLDHEWSSTLLDPDAAGWDWTGMNLDDGGALMAYNFRRHADGASLYSYATLRTAAGVRAFGPAEVAFTPLDHWTSPRTRARYPVAMRIRVGDRTFESRPLMPDQELDSRATTGQVYWEGASTLTENGRRVGRGYLELTGYAAPMNL